MSLLNVRLTKADEQAVRVLRRSGIEISSVVKEALRREAERHRPRTAASVAKLLEDIFEAFPEPAKPAARKVDVHDRRAFAEAFRAHVRGKARR